MAQLPSKKRPALTLEISINGEPTSWSFRRISTLERLEQAAELANVRSQIQRQSLAVIDVLGVLKKIEAQETLSEADRESMLKAHAASPDSAAALTAYAWLDDLVLNVTGFVDADGDAVAWATIEDSMKQDIVRSIELHDAIVLIDRVITASQMTEIDKGKSKPGLEPGAPASTASTSDEPTPS